MKVLLTFLLLLTLSATSFADQRAPQAEPPYPEYPQPRNQENRSGVEQPKAKNSKGAYLYDTSVKKKKPVKRSGVALPKDVSSDGSYYYGTSSDSKKSKNRPGIEQPSDQDSDGSYYYSTKKENNSAIKRSGVEKPNRIESDGTFIYGEDDNNTYDATYYFSLGVLGPFPWGGSTPGSQTYEDVYSSQPNFLLSGGYEWKMFDFLGSLLVKFDTGMMFAEGKGQFNGTSNINTGKNLDPKETFQLYVFPNTLSLVYRFESSPSQYFIPYIDGGIGYFTFWERRTDDKKNVFGGATVFTGGAGLLISLKAFNRLFGTKSIDSEYGVNQSWFNLQYRRIFGLDARKDLSSNMISAGVALGF